MLQDLMIPITIMSFLFTITFIFLRPNVNEAIPATVGALFVLLSGSVTLSDLGKITETIGGAAITIMATIVMAIVLESFGFFHWAAEIIVEKAKGSGIRLFWLVNLFCFLMTLFVNNDGSILITTPILLMLLHHMGLKNHQKIPYLLSGALIATASSAPIGVSNIVNLIALKIVNMTLYMHTAMMFVPATIGLLLMVTLLYFHFRKILPHNVPINISGLWNYDTSKGNHPLKPKPLTTPSENRGKTMRNILIFVFVVRVGLFVASYLGIPVAFAAIFGSLILLGWRWYRLKISPLDMVKKTPWYIIVFAFSMYVIIYGLHNIGLTELLVQFLQPIAHGSMLKASFMMGILVSVLSDIFNNHPALMVGTITLTSMGLDPLTLKVSYLASIIGSDIGSLFLPIGTLASIMWMHIVKKGKVKITWGDYLKATWYIIPITVMFTLVILAFWVTWIF
ncbi:arsenic transporter [Paenibacillus aceris]|uniref:Arsenical pump membrane protein n=1 Tax=Paenibacillus aceris TaxID=869555 RepID=A0ABS4HQM4_9BACL|nr:arsenic transporter [Paenibacillus aceris]MBP1960914.1 arsenical pump membrane protein [Paenibacillus aceris]